MYNYKTERPFLFTEEGVVLFLAVRDRVKQLIAKRESFTMSEAIDHIGKTATNWELMACVDRMVELGEVWEVSRPDVAGQFRTFIRKGEPHA